MNPLFRFAWFVLLLSFAACSEESVRGLQPPTTILLVRHAEKVEDGSKNPPLAEKGSRRAAMIRELFASTDFDGLYATPFERTINTLKPLADTLGRTVETYDPNLDLVVLMDQLLDKHAGKSIFITGHSNTIPGMLNVLIGRNDYEDFTHDQYNDIFMVSLTEKGKASVTRLQLVVPE